MISAVAMTAIPSPRPVKRRWSVVVAPRLTGAAITGVSYAALVWWAHSEDPRTPADVLDEALQELTPLLAGSAG